MEEIQLDMLSVSSAVVIAAVLIAALYYSLVIPEASITGDAIILGSGGYDIRILSSPVATGRTLQVITYALTYFNLGGSIRRKLLNDNHVEVLRELASQVVTPPMHYPMHRLNADEWNKAAELAASSTPLLQTEQIESYDVKYHQVRDFAEAYRTGRTTPSKVAKKALDAVKDFEKRGLRIFSSVLDGDVMKQAVESDERFRRKEALSLFDGVLVAFKDMMDVNGHTICDGKHRSLCVKVFRDDPIVARFREAGAIIFGVTIMPEGGVTPLGYSAHFQGPHSPYSSQHYSGGSSSGSAVAVATGIVPVAVGFDGGGSIRIPACLSGIHGFGTGFGRVAFNNRTSTTMIKSGPMTTSALDAAMAYEVMSQPLKGHFYSQLYDGEHLGMPKPTTAGFRNTADLSDIRIGIFEDWFNDSDPEVRSACRRAVAVLVGRGATVVNITIPHLQWLGLAHGIKISSEFALAFDKSYYKNWGDLETNTRITVGLGKSMTAVEVLAAEKLRGWAFDFMHLLFKEHSLSAIANPTVGILPPPLTDDAKLYGESNSPLVLQMMKYINMGNFLGPF